MKSTTKAFIIINIIALVGLIITFKALLTIFTYSPAFSFNFTVSSIISVIFFASWAITGLILFVTFLKRLSFSTKLFFVSISATAVYAGFILALVNINSIDYQPVQTFRKVSQISANYSLVYVYIGILSVLYLVFLAVAYKMLTKPIKKVKNACLSLSNENYRDKIKIGGSKEFSEIGKYLHEINHKMQEKDKVLKKTHDEYEKIVPKEFLKYLGKKDFVELELGQGISKVATTMFCDIRKSTQKSETLSLEENFNFINSYLSMIGPLVRKHGGFVDKYLGDGILAVFSSSDGAVLCAVEIIKTIRIKNTLKAEMPDIEVGIGIHTGEVIFGVVGEKERKTPTIISDNVNYASKMQNLSKTYNSQVLISKRTLNDSKELRHMAYRYLGSLRLSEEESRFAVFELLESLPIQEKLCLEKNKTVFENAVRLFEEAKYKDAKSLFDDVVARCPNDVATKIYLAKCRENLVKKI